MKVRFARIGYRLPRPAWQLWLPTAINRRSRWSFDCPNVRTISRGVDTRPQWLPLSALYSAPGGPFGLPGPQPGTQSPNGLHRVSKKLAEGMGRTLRPSGDCPIWTVEQQLAARLWPPPAGISPRKSGAMLRVICCCGRHRLKRRVAPSRWRHRFRRPVSRARSNYDKSQTPRVL